MVAAAALANAQTFGGTDYVGYHAEMALIPSLSMASQLPKTHEALPVLKVIYRNSLQIQDVGGTRHKTMHHHDHDEQTQADADLGTRIREASRSRNMDRAEDLFASVEHVPIEDRFNAILPTIEDDINVHRFVLAQRSMELIDIVGEAHAQTMLRQCVRYCVDEEQIMHKRGRRPSAIRKLLPRLISQYRLDSIQLGEPRPG